MWGCAKLFVHLEPTTTDKLKIISSIMYLDKPTTLNHEDHENATQHVGNMFTLSHLKQIK